ncbi:Cytochrome c family protein [Paramagnetospirillum magnetotacticum MS-1]|uniref:Cytochrome c family protein n=2 Tax=Paramagnetospirillum magnetotacticum TaxID=188 RepID=A0A0C2YYS4_PARME|nr:Cytochrome c family protein [Paramagnetospirillum magnetotacticum MS-1]
MNAMKTRLLTLALLLAVPSALAHGTMVAFFGGQIAESGEYRAEFAVRDGSIRVWLRDHDDKPVKATGKATLLLGGQKLEADLTPKGDGLIASVPVKAKDKLTAVLGLNVDSKPVSLRFQQAEVVMPAVSGAAEAGRVAFEAVCATCHGSALRGTDGGPPLLHEFYALGSAHGDDVILAAMNEGAKSHMWKFGDMPKPQGLKDGQDKEVLAYIRAVQTANGLGGSPADAHSGHGHH